MRTHKKKRGKGYSQPPWTGTGWLPNGTAVALSGSSLRGIKLTATHQGCNVIRVYSFYEGPSQTTRRLMITERGWVEIERKDIELMEKAWN